MRAIGVPALVLTLVVGASACSGEESSGRLSATPTASGSTSSTVAPTPTSSTTTSAPSTAGRPALRGRVIVIDPGHNGGNARALRQVNRTVDAGFGVRKPCNSTGTATNAGYAEHAQVWDVANRLASLLRAQGARVVLTRPTDDGVGPCIDVRGRSGGRAKADLMLSIHADGNSAASARGFHVLQASRMTGGASVQAASAQLATTVRAAFAKSTGMPYATYTGGGVGLTRRPDLGTLNLSTVPAVMIETGNMRNRTDAALLSDPAFRQREAAGLAGAIRTYLAR
ncbi:N-acetylmuramoyl-L-alanine amidase [Luteipulveratus flavus]|uniref:N-acetylmuramoyl-L-alanine amidase n=1 Tax=Luteipulveratus flavus TaxID=3031728 RepID=A0ABT6C3V6_9MICO|nr:N-acetylmuramoyl-L-alanine amidase [Luteipulveratus sp. YIM 133296]MDF8263624.1 N-acetylmuramoyl-L-alanine amidase [Luteipulveratus sp. YIM 133296]